MSTLRTLTLAALLAAGTTLAHAGKDCHMTADGDDLVAPPVRSAKADAKDTKAPAARDAQRQGAAAPATLRTGAATKAVETKKP
jgi:hypothetical protein